MIGKVFGRLKVLSLSEEKKHRRRCYVCVCVCGSIRMYVGNALRSGNTKSCGCLRKDVPNHRKHNLRKHPLYVIFTNMKARCYNSKNPAFIHYGGRGIAICKAWLRDFYSFYKWAVSSGWRKGLEIDRKNNDKGYYPGNCRLVTRVINIRNRRSTIKIFVLGKQVALSEVSERTGIKYSTLFQRIFKLKWPIEEAIKI